MGTARIYYDGDGNECTIHQMVKREPGWAATRIQAGEDAIADLARVTAERDRLRAALQSMLKHLSTARDCIDNSHRFYQSQAAFSAVQEARAALNGEGEG